MFLQIQDRKFWYTESGTGIPVVLLHGYLESSEVWNGFRDKLSLKFRVISVDLPGHGLSEVYGEVHSMDFMAGVVKELLDHLGIKKIILAGHSLGGYVALAFLELFPDYLSGYCLIHSQPLADTPEAIEKRKREIAIVKAGKKDLMYPENVERMFASSNLPKFGDELRRSKNIASVISGEGIIAVLNGMMQRPSRVAVMEKGMVPCLWILGAMDNYIQCEAIQKKLNLPANAKTVVMENSGHMGFIEEEELSLVALTGFINENL